MSKAPVIYAVQSGLRVEGGIRWYPLLDGARQRITFTGPGSKSKAIALVSQLSTWQRHEALRVKRGSDVVWEWTREKPSA